MRAADTEPIFTALPVYAGDSLAVHSLERVGFSAANYTHARLPLGLYAGHVAVYQPYNRRRDICQDLTDMTILQINQ